MMSYTSFTEGFYLSEKNIEVAGSCRENIALEIV